MTDLFPSEKPKEEDATDAFRPSSIWDISRQYLFVVLIGFPTIFLLSFLPGKHGIRLHLTLLQRIGVAFGLAVLGVAMMWWRDENPS